MDIKEEDFDCRKNRFSKEAVMRKKWLVVMLVGLMVAGLAGSAAAKGWGTKASGPQVRRFVGKDWPEKQTIGPRSRLNLTAEQKGKIVNLRLTFREETLELRTQLTRKRLEMQKLLLEESPDLTEVNALVDEMASVQAEIQKKAIEFGLKLKSLLTKEQLDKLPEWDFGQRFGRAMGRRGPMGGSW
jgi:Spy/CpxP family protein refolding chaperone